LVGQDDDFTNGHGGRFKLLICRGQSAPPAVNALLAMNLAPALTIKINASFNINVPSSFALASESATRAPMNEILFVIGDLPVRTGAALIGFGALALLLLLSIAIVIARSGRRGAEMAMAQAIRADELEERLSEMLRAQSEATGRVDAMGQALVGRQAEMTRAVNERLDSVTHRVGQSMEQTTRNTMDSLRMLHERLGIIDNAHKNLTDLTSQVTTLRDVLANKQSRGAFGQARMEAIVQDGMPKGSYEFQFTLSTGKRPDCVVFLPDQRPLCIDAKFPLEAMTALHDARSDEEKKSATQRLRTDVMKHVSDIAEKYLIAGETQDTALMFVPSESVYAEIHDGFDDVIQKAYRARVVLVSPSLLMLAIQVMQQILKDARMRDAADQIRTEVLNLGDDLSRLRDRVLKLQNHFGQANEDVRQILISADKIEKRAGRIEELDFSKSEAPAETPRIVKSAAPELFPLPRQLQAGE
jgi:DNA recombination protein RmuC